LELISRLAPSLSPVAAEFALQTLALLTTDHTVIHNGALSLSLSKTISRLVSCLPEDTSENILNRVIETLFDGVRDPVLFANIIHSLPTIPPRAHLFRRRLALAFALDSTKNVLAPSSLMNPALTAHIILAISSSDAYSITPGADMDYSALSARLRILDVAIDMGFIARSPPHGTSIAHQTQAHDLAIGELIDVVRLLMDSIVTTGASHISRLEARSSAERVAQRLEHAVRIKAKRLKNYYADGDMEAQKNMMKQFVSAAPGAAAGTKDGSTTNAITNKKHPNASAGADASSTNTSSTEDEGAEGDDEST
jgi:hypothetical protein